ncbi:MAG: hypothetical protein N3D09_00655 [Archaeoglobaceae archaeon]|nr:hypothetical protein [Archaeoglobaceae archaeon]
MGQFLSDSTILEISLITTGLLLLLLFLLIIVPGFFIWFALILTGKRRSIFKCGFANLVAFVASASITLILVMIPLLSLFSPIIFLVIYLWVFKEILDLGWLRAIFTVAIGVACVMILSIIFTIIFSAIFKPPWIPEFRF